MKRISLRTALATLLLAACTAAPAQDVPVPGPAAAADPAATNTVPPVLVRDVRVQTIGEERHIEALPPGLLFLDAETGRLMVADDDNPHGRLVCACRDIDWHSLTNDLRVNGHRILLNDAFSLQAEGGAVSLRHGTNSLLQILAADYGSLAPLSASLEDATHLLLTANAPADAVLQTTTNLLDPAGWQPAANAVVAEATDAATTWRITLLDGTVPEFYRVLATVSRPVGIHANAPLHANSGIVMDGTTWTSFPDTNAFLTAETDAAALAALATETSARSAADSALDGAVASVERRVEALETNGTYYCRWSTSDVSQSQVNWIPTNGWPSSTIDLQLYPASSNLFVGIRENWEPTNNLRIAITLTRAGLTSGTTSGGIRIGTNTVATFQTSSNRRRYELTWVPETKVWMLDDYALAYHSFVFDSSGTSRYGPLPNDVFLPEFDEETEPTLAMSPSLSPSVADALLSPAALQPEEDPLDEPDFDDPQEPETDR